MSSTKRFLVTPALDKQKPLVKNCGICGAAGEGREWTVQGKTVRCPLCSGVKRG